MFDSYHLIEDIKAPQEAARKNSPYGSVVGIYILFGTSGIWFSGWATINKMKVSKIALALCHRNLSNEVQGTPSITTSLPIFIHLDSTGANPRFALYMQRRQNPLARSQMDGVET